MNDLERYFREKYLSENTIKTYLRNISIFINWYSGEIINIDPIIVDNYKKYLMEERKISIRSVAAYFNSLKIFIKYVYERYKIVTKLSIINEYGKLIRVNIPHIKHKIKDINYNKELSVKEVKRLLKSALKANERDYLLFLTMTLTGMRVSETLSLKVFQLKDLMIEVTLKGRTRSLILPPSLKSKLKKFTKDFESESYIFKSNRKLDKALDRKTVYSLMQKYAGEAKLKKEKCFPHNLRKHYTVNEINIGTDIQTLADELGHKNLETLRIYKERSVEEKRKRMQKIAKKYG